MTTLFEHGSFKLKSGATSEWKIECDALTNDDWKTLAAIGAKLVGEFSSVWSCGGASEKFALALREHISDARSPPLVVDDVLTTGKTMELMRKALTRSLPDPEIKGLVAFARGECPSWVQALFRVNMGVR